MERQPSLAARLRADHQLLVEVLDEIEATPTSVPSGERHGGTGPTRTQRTLVRLVSAHVEASDLLVRLGLERLSDGPLVALQADEEHRTMLEHVAVLQRVERASPAYAGALDGLSAELRQHLAPEEELVDRLDVTLSEQERASLHHDYELVRAGVLLGESVVPLDRVSAAAVRGAGVGETTGAAHDPRPG